MNNNQTKESITTTKLFLANLQHDPAVDVPNMADEEELESVDELSQQQIVPAEEEHFQQQWDQWHLCRRAKQDQQSHRGARKRGTGIYFGVHERLYIFHCKNRSGTISASGNACSLGNLHWLPNL